VAWFAERGISVERVLSDNGSAYKSFLWRDSCAELGIAMTRTRPRRPQTNGKIARFHRTLADGWAYKKLYRSEDIRRDALAVWLHQYNHHRPAPLSRRWPSTHHAVEQPGWASQLDTATITAQGCTLRVDTTSEGWGLLLGHQRGPHLAMDNG